MQMEYNLLFHSKKGFLTTRKPELADDKLYITFTNAPENATAIFENSAGDSLYRLLQDITCEVPDTFLKDGDVTVCVTVLDSQHIAPKYNCEAISVRTINGKILLYPAGLDIEKELVDMRVENQEIKDKIAKMLIKQSEQDQKIAKLLEGYDFD